MGIFSSVNSKYSPVGCGSLLLQDKTRRHFMQQVGGGILFTSMGMMALGAKAASGNYEAMVLSCIDPRFQDLVSKQQAADGLVGKYSAFTIAGASIGVVAPVFQAWQQAFWDNLGTSVQLHNIKKVIVVNHRDCGAAKIAYGEAKVATPELETETHKAALLAFRDQLKIKQPALAVQLGLMGLDGKLEIFS